MKLEWPHTERQTLTRERTKRLKNNLDLLKEKRDEATLQAAAYKQRMTKYYNSRIRMRRFAVRDLMLKKMSLTTQNLTEEKLRPNWKGPYRVTSCNRPETYYLETI